MARLLIADDDGTPWVEILTDYEGEGDLYLHCCVHGRLDSPDAGSLDDLIEHYGKPHADSHQPKGTG